MKPRIGLLLLLALGAVPALAGQRHITVHVKGMVCAFCSQGITKKFKAQDAVNDVHVDMTKKEVQLALKLYW